MRAPGELAEFIDANAAFVAQKGVYEYSRARAGHYSKVLFTEPAFIEAVDQSRWRAFPLGLAMVGEVVEGVLRQHSGPLSGQEADLQLGAISALALSVFDRYPVPTTLGEEDWRAARDKLAGRLRLIGLHPPKLAKDVPEPYARAYFELMPIHEKLRGRDFSTIHNYLKATLCNIHEELTKRVDAPAMAIALAGTAASNSVGVVPSPSVSPMSRQFERE